MYKNYNDSYDEQAIKDAEKRTDKYKSEKSMKEVKRFINSKLFKDLDFPLDEDEPENEIDEF